MREAVAALDHLLIGAPTLESGIAWLEERTGVRATPGGSHPGLGTWNALASLGPRQYLEIIAPDPAQQGIETFYVPGLRAFPRPRLATWAAQQDRIATAWAPAPPDFLCEPPREGSRVRPDQTRLAWTLAFPKHREHGVFDGALPFLIEWDKTSPHPGESTPGGLTLLSLSFEHPNAEALSLSLRAMGIESVASPSSAVCIRASIKTPRGVILV
jgi:hypothetical protein